MKDLGKTNMDGVNMAAISDTLSSPYVVVSGNIIKSIA